MNKLRTILDGQGHLVRSSGEVVRRISKITICERLIMVKADIKDFHVVGHAHTIAEKVSCLFSDVEERALVFSVVYFLLDSQYVSHDKSDTMCTRVLA